MYLNGFGLNVFDSFNVWRNFLISFIYLCDKSLFYDIFGGLNEILKCFDK